MDRGERYEDPLIDALENSNIADVVGGGSMLLAGGNEIGYCCIDLDIHELEHGVPLICSILEAAGAPLGSYLSYDHADSSHRIPFGKNYGIGIYLNGTDLPDSVYADCDVNYLVSEINRLLRDIGSCQSNWQGPTETALYVYGSSRDSMRELLRDLIENYPLCERARVVDLPDAILEGG